MSTTMQGAQRVLMLVLPLAFIPFILNFPAGLMLYWVTTNLWTTGQGLVTRRLMPKPQPPPKRSSRTPPRDDGTRRQRRQGRRSRRRSRARGSAGAGAAREAQEEGAAR